MKKLVQIISILLVVIFAAGNISAQSKNPMLIVSFQKVKMADMQKANKVISEKIAPVINALVDEGMLEGWGQFNHAWGDEWNMNVWYVAKDMDSFNKFFDEYINRLNKQQPEAWAELRGYIQEHKDNIYSIQNQYPLPQE